MMHKKRRTLRLGIGRTTQQEPPVYCVCRSTDGDRFMIACDRCEEWYHGDCINVTSKQAEQIKRFYCHQCRRKEPSLEIEYKFSRNPRIRPYRKRVGLDSRSGGDASFGKRSKVTGNKVADANAVKPTLRGKFKQDRLFQSQSNHNQAHPEADPKVSPASVIESFDDTKESPLHSSYFPRDCWPLDSEFKYEDDNSYLSHSQPPINNSALSLRSRSCGSCGGCTRSDDCGKCDHCRDRRKFGGPNRMRQKCRLRQCTKSSSQMRGSIGSPTVGSRRRKQQTLHGVLLGANSPHLRDYTDFDDEPFEVPTDFCPRSCSDLDSSSLYGNQSSMQSYSGMKNRRLSRDPVSTAHDFGIERPFHQFQLNAVGDSMDFLDEDSEDDIVISGLPHCAGPACMSAPIPGTNYCSETCRIKHVNSRCGSRSSFPGVGFHLHDPIVPYNLPYPDHMYCRHHKVYDWHGVDPTSNDFRSRSLDPSYDTGFRSGTPNISDGLFQSRNLALCRLPGSINQRPQKIPDVHSHGSSRNFNNHTTGINEHVNSVLRNSNVSSGFIDPMESVIRRTVPPLLGDLSHSTQTTATHVSPSGMLSINPYYTRPGSDMGRASVNVRRIEAPDECLGVEGEDAAVGMSHSGNSYYYMIPFSDAANCHGHQAVLDEMPDTSDKRMDAVPIGSRTLGARHLLSDHSESSEELDPQYSSTRSVLPSSSIRCPNISTPISLTASSRPNENIAPMTSADPANGSASSTTMAVSGYLPESEEFYTINDSDDLEINWPQDSVHSGNG